MHDLTPSNFEGQIHFRVVADHIAQNITAYWHDVDIIGEPSWVDLSIAARRPTLGSFSFDSGVVIALAFSRMSEVLMGRCPSRAIRAGRGQIYMLGSGIHDA